MKREPSNEPASAFAEMLRPHHEYLARFSIHLTGDPDDGRDLYHQAVLKALEKRAKLKDAGRFRPWMCAIIVNEHRTILRKERLRRLFGGNQRQEKGRPTAGSLPAGRGPDERLGIQRCLRQLAPMKREAIILFEVQGFSLAEVAEIQRCSLTAAKTRISRARRELRRLYLSDGAPDAAIRASQEKAHELRVSMEARK